MKIKSRKWQKEVTAEMGNLLECDYGWNVRSEDLRCKNCKTLFGFTTPNYCPKCGTKIEHEEADYDHIALWEAFLAGLKKFKENK